MDDTVLNVKPENLVAAENEEKKAASIAPDEPLQRLFGKIKSSWQRSGHASASPVDTTTVCDEAFCLPFLDHSMSLQAKDPAPPSQTQHRTLGCPGDVACSFTAKTNGKSLRQAKTNIPTLLLYD